MTRGLPRVLVAIVAAITALAAGCSARTGADDTDDASTPTSVQPGEPTSDTEADTEPNDPPTPDDTADVDPEVDPATGADQSPVEAIEWRSCDGGLECGTVEVPLDYDEADGTRLDIALVRVPAEGDPVGSIFVNPGGPGASGVEFVQGGFRLDPETADRYHLIGFDPRGIGLSSPLACSVERGESTLPDLSPDSAEETALLDREAVEVVESCAQSDGTVLPHLTTLNVARDLDRLRRAVGDDRLHFYGLSYGTLLAVRYGQLFGDTVGHLVLDGVVDPNAELGDLLRQQAVAFETGFELLDERCDEVRCPAGGITATFDRVRNRLEEDGPVGDVGASELVIASLLPAYSPSVFAAYAVALEQADDGNYTAIETLSDFFVGSVSFTAYAAFACADGEPPTGSDSWERFAADLEELAPRFGAVVANELRVCAYWPEPADDQGGGVSAESVAEVDRPILVIGNTGDAATPLVNAERVAALLPDARLVVVDSARHTAYNGSSCVRELVADYFADRSLADLSNCDPD